MSQQKMRRCFKSSDIFEKTYDFFHALAVTNSTTLESSLGANIQWLLSILGMVDDLLIDGGRL